MKIRKHLDQNGAPQVFDNPAAINNGVTNGSPIRLAYPGEAGQRNKYRGDGYFDIDSGLAKTFKITESQGVKFAWEVFNVTNSARFDVNPLLSWDHLDGGHSRQLFVPLHQAACDAVLAALRLLI